MKHYVAAIDGIPGILPGTVQVPPPPQEIEDPQPAPRSKEPKYCAREVRTKPRHKIRMMPCDRK